VAVDRKAKMATVECGKCHIRELIPVKSIEEKIDAYGSFIDSWYRKYEFETETSVEDVEGNQESTDDEGKDTELENANHPTPSTVDKKD
jgi:transcription elongation factor Elf1